LIRSRLLLRFDRCVHELIEVDGHDPGLPADEDALYFTAAPGRGARTQVKLFPLEPDRVTIRARDAQGHDR
jgi:hypothetical protein